MMAVDRISWRVDHRQSRDTNTEKMHTGRKEHGSEQAGKQAECRARKARRGGSIFETSREAEDCDAASDLAIRQLACSKMEVS